MWLKTAFFSVGVMALSVAGIGILAAQDWSGDLSVSEIKECLQRERSIEEILAEIAAREDRMGQKMAQAEELTLRASNLRGTARVDASARVSLINIELQIEEAMQIRQADEERVKSALQAHEIAVQGFNKSCAGGTYKPSRLQQARAELGWDT